jgi:hypothetical protein
MNTRKTFIILSILVIVLFSSVQALCTNPSINVDNQKNEVASSETKATSTTTTETTSINIVEEETTSKTSETITKETTENTTSTTEATKTAPTIKLNIYEGPSYSQADNVCYYRIEAKVTGEPAPDVTFSKDDSNGSWGKYKVQINLNQDETYTITAIATNSEGSDKDSVELSWGCDLPKPEIIEDVTDASTNDGTSTLKKVYSEQELEYFFEIAFGTEYGSSTTVLHKCTSNIRIKVNGIPTSTDLDTLNQLIAELNTLVSSISLSIVSDNPNVEIYFTTVSQFPLIEPSYISGNMGYFSVWWNATGAIYKGRILIASDMVSQQERSHLIREELTQNIGLFKDSWRYQDSIFYQGWTDTIAYAPIDCSIISLLYDPSLRPGMTQDQVKGAFGIN